MHRETAITIRATPQTVYALAADIERWPDRLPHYRYVRVLRRDGDRTVAAMGARRGVLPVRWTAEQVRQPEVPRIGFRHVGGVTRGMDVEWRFEPVADGVRVTILHDLHLRWPVIGGLVARWVIGAFFIEHIARRTLRQVKRLAEAADAGHAPGAEAVKRGE